MGSAIMVLVLKEKKEGDPIKRYTITLPCIIITTIFFKRAKG
jgi:hypothetical protein